MKCRLVFLYLFLISMYFQSNCYADSTNELVGVNLSGAEYGSSALPGKNGFTYIWHTPDDIKRFADSGFNVIRIPFLWERMQPELKMPLNNDEAHYLDLIVEAANSKNIKIIIDPHNFGAYRRNLIGTDQVTSEDFQDFWSKMAERYKKYPNVIFGLMNEPNKQSSVEWAKIAQAGINGIRITGAKQLILVPGTHWSAAHSWTKADFSPSNADALISIKDPMNNFAYEMHDYLDASAGGIEATCVSADIGPKRLQDATAWLKQNGRKGFLGEFGTSDEGTCMQALGNTLEYLKTNRDAWLGWTYWSASKWGGRYKFDIFTLNTEQQKQFSVIKPFLKNSGKP